MSIQTYSYLFGFLLIILTGCTSGRKQKKVQSSSQPASKLMITLRPDTAQVDTAAIANEIEGLIGLTDEGSGRVDYKVSSAGNDSLLSLTIHPKVTRQIKSNLSHIFDSLVQHPSPLPPFETTLEVTEKDPKVLDFLDLTTGSTHPLQPAPYQVEWAYEQKEIPNQFSNSSYVITYLRYGLIRPLPELSYTYDTSKNNSAAAKAAQQIFNTLGPRSAAYLIHATAPQAEENWDSLRTNFQLQFYPGKMQVRWNTVDFDTEPSSFSAADTLLQADIDKLITTKPYVFHILIAPELSRRIAGYRFEEDPAK